MQALYYAVVGVPDARSIVNRRSPAREVPHCLSTIILFLCLFFAGFISHQPRTAIAQSQSSDGAGVLAQGDAAAGQTTECSTAYRQVARGTTCQAMFDFQKKCSGNLNLMLVTTALRLRCADELFEQKHKVLQESFAKAEQQKTCASMTSFIEQYSLDFELSDAPEMEKANVLRTRFCEEEAQDKERAALDAHLRRVISTNDCAEYRAFERQNGVRLGPEQSNLLTTAMKQRCEIEEKANTELRACLERNENAGNFCAAADCFRAFKAVLPQDSYFAPYGAESKRQEKICKEYSAMRNCFISNECGGEQCSLSLRLAVAKGPLMSFIQRQEQDASRSCNARLERERIAKIEAEREEQRREEETRRQIRQDSTVRLTLCNRSAYDKIWVVLSYYDYDAGNWIVEGWWPITRGDCTYFGDQFRRGTTYFYAHTAGENRVWRGDFGLCVTWSRFRRVNRGTTCSSREYRFFRHVEINGEEFTLNLN
jgi:uncharacterized membrane protein